MQRILIGIALIGCAALGWAAAVLLRTMPREMVQLSRPVPSPTVVPASTASVSLVFVGDMMLSRSVGDAMARRDDWLWPFRIIASVTREADLAFGNLETTISLRGAPAGCGYCFRADPRVTQGLVYAGFDMLSVANNHIWDYGADAFADTLAAVAATPMQAVGGGLDATSARSLVVRNAGNLRVGFLAYTNILPASACATGARGGAHCYNAETFTTEIASASGDADVLVVSFHAGDEYQPHNAFQERVYRAAIDAGADLVIGHHPHVVQDVERYHGGVIAYSLGNFIFDQLWSAETMRGMMLRVTYVSGVLRRVEQIPLALDRQFQTSLAVPNESGTLNP